jgi:DNA-binding NarL/FixJ family response regulator
MVLEPTPGIEVVGEAGDGAAGVAEATRLRPDVVLMDVRMPDVDGIEATRRIIALGGPPVRVLMLTTFDLSDYLLEAVRAGVSGFTVKDTPPDDLVAGVLAIARDDALIAPATTVELIESVTRSHPPPVPPGVGELLPPELAVLELIARGLSNAEIATDLGESEATVAARVAHILATLRVRDRIHAVVAAHAAGVALRTRCR